jgi:hypothetical protein
MSTEQIVVPSKAGVLETPQAPLVSTFVAVVLGSSLIEFNEILFPPKLTSLNFWALVAVYYGAFATWFGITTSSRGRAYTDTFLARVWLMSGIMMLVSYVGLMFFAVRATDSLICFMWGWVAVFFFYWASSYFRYRDLRLPEPFGLCAIHGSLALIAAIAYSVLATAFPPVPTFANWIFLFVAFGIIASYRTLLRVRRTWQDVPNDCKLQRANC